MLTLNSLLKVNQRASYKKNMKLNWTDSKVNDLNSYETLLICGDLRNLADVI